MSWRRLCILFFLLASALLVSNVRAQISKGNLILIDRGLQMQGLVTLNSDTFHLSTYTNANYTSLAWTWSSDVSVMGAAPGLPWSRWVNNTPEMPPLGNESAYMSNLVILSLSDEPYLNVEYYFNKMTNWFLTVRDNWPNTILNLNSWGGEVDNSVLSAFIDQGKPDMVSFDLYPSQSYTNNGVPIPGPPTAFYSELRRYRAW